MKVITKTKESLKNLAVGATSIGGMLITAAVTNDPQLSVAIGGASGELLARKLTKQRDYMGLVREYIIEDIKRRQNNNELFRTDGFLGGTTEKRSDFDDLVDSILLKAADELNQKKLRHIGYLTSSFAYPPAISADSAHRLIKDVENLSYRQLCLMKIASDKEEVQLCDKSITERPGEAYHVDYTPICDECLDLYDQGYIYVELSREVGNLVPGARSIAVRPSSISLGPKLSSLYDRMRLSEIPPKDIDPIVFAFNYNWAPDQS